MDGHNGSGELENRQAIRIAVDREVWLSQLARLEAWLIRLYCVVIAELLVIGVLLATH